MKNLKTKAGLKTWDLLHI